MPSSDTPLDSVPEYDPTGTISSTTIVELPATTYYCFCYFFGMSSRVPYFLSVFLQLEVVLGIEFVEYISSSTFF
jgi:hypothetical protein